METDKTKSDINRILKQSNQSLRSHKASDYLEYTTEIEVHVFDKLLAKIGISCPTINPKLIQGEDFR